MRRICARGRVICAHRLTPRSAAIERRKNRLHIRRMGAVGSETARVGAHVLTRKEVQAIELFPSCAPARAVSLRFRLSR